MQPHHPLFDTLARALAAPGPMLLVVRGSAGAGVSTLIRAALPAGRQRLWYAASPLADADHRALLAARLGSVRGNATEAAARHDPAVVPGAAAEAAAEAAAADRLAADSAFFEAAVANGPYPDAAPAWEDLLEALRESVDATRAPLIVVLDNAHHLLAARSRLPGLLATFWAAVRARALPLHLVLAGRGTTGLAELAVEGPLAGFVSLDLRLPPLGLRPAVAGLSRWPARERLLAWSIFGGSPALLHHVDGSASLATNVRRLVLERDAPFLRHGADLMQGALQSPARYGSVLRALALGRREWGELVSAVPEFGSAGQLAPYLARMEALGWIEVERSLDAPARSRSRRYRIADPFLSFWFRFVPPALAELEAGEGAQVWRRSIRPALDAHMALHFGRLCRAWLVAHGEEMLPGAAREAGGLWGAGYDLEVAATLRTGAACYGRCLWGQSPAGVDVVEELNRGIALTRYGFGRESRIRLVFSAAGFDAALQRRSAREPPVRLVGVDDLVGA